MKRFSGGSFPKGERFFALFFDFLLLLFYSNFTKVRFLILHTMFMIRHVKTNQKHIKNETWRNY